jgi:DNA-binding transcriptional ArsR family regulator
LARRKEAEMIEPELIPLVAQRFKALGEPARLALLAALQQGERSVSQLVEATGRGQPNVSQHLKELVHARLVAARREGSHVYYRIADHYVTRICDAVCRSVRGAALPARGARAARPRARRTRTVAPVATEASRG